MIHVNAYLASILLAAVCALAVSGGKEVQIPANVHLAAIASALRAGGNLDYRVIELEGLHHCFRRCRTGLPPEYPTGEEAWAPEAPETVTDWISEVAAPDRAR